MKKPAVIFIVLLLAAGLGYGVVRLLLARFAQGDIYPPYSTLRADGLGSKALHDSLGELMPVERNYKRLSEFEPAENKATIFMLGVENGFEDDPDVADDLEKLAQDGNRIVLAFVAVDKAPRDGEFFPTATPTPEQTPGKDEKSDKDETRKKTKKEKVDELHQRWGVKTAFLSKPLTKAVTEIPGLEPLLSWHSAMYFTKLDPEWLVLYSCDGKPVVIERPFGNGSIVLVADAYFSSNEALSKEPAPGLISVLVGGSRTAVFDETHLGVNEDPGIASLTRKFKLHYAVLALLCVALLFVWRNAASFVPRREEEAGAGEVVGGFDASAAFVSLLKRNIPFDKIVETCLVEWKRSFGHRAKAALVARVDAAAAAGAKTPVETFQTITKILNEKR